MADEATVMALNVREMHFSISRSLVLVYETINFAFIRYLNKNEIINSHLIVFFKKRTMMVQKVIVRVGRQTKFQSQQKAILLRVMIEKFPGRCCFPLSILVSSIKIKVKKVCYVCRLFK